MENTIADFSQFFPNLLLVLLTAILGIIILPAFNKQRKLLWGRSRPVMQIMTEDNSLLLLRQSRETAFPPDAQDEMSELGFPPVFIEGRLTTNDGNLTFYILDTTTFVKNAEESRKENRLLHTNPEVFAVFQNVTDLKESPVDMWIIPSYVSSHYESECFRFDVMINPIKTAECFRMSISEADLKGIIRFVKKEKPTIDKITTLYQPPS